MSLPSTPKLRASTRPPWYPYYAGFADAFVRDCLDGADLPHGSRVLDPWNGSGTSTTAAVHAGHVAVGFDLNPAMVIVAKARLIRRDLVASLRPLAVEIVENASPIDADSNEPLTLWFKGRTAALWRRLERAIARTLVATGGPDLAEHGAVGDMTPLAAFYYLALFRALRDELTPFRSSNPTWIRLPSDSEDRLGSDWRTVTRRFRSQVAALCSAVSQAGIADPETSIYTINVGDARNLAVPTSSIDYVITSPPYCTRIDYAVTTRPELAILGIGNGDRMTRMRSDLTGGVKIRPVVPEIQESWGHTCTRFLSKAARHASKASSGYYSKQFRQYFADLSVSIAELGRVIKVGGRATVVVQDSLYKDIHLDLPTVVEEMAEGAGFTCMPRYEYRVSHSMRQLNAVARTYKSTWKATEAAVNLRHG